MRKFSVNIDLPSNRFALKVVENSLFQRNPLSILWGSRHLYIPGVLFVEELLPYPNFRLPILH
jgi:hypothetical protein